jgi:hypothetical protein
VGRKNNGGAFEGGQDPEGAVVPYMDGGCNTEYSNTSANEDNSFRNHIR